VSLTPSVLLKPPAPAPHGKEPPGAPPDTPFATVLDDHQARTAVAEGRQTQGQGVASRSGTDQTSQTANADDAHATDRPTHAAASADAGSSGQHDRQADDPRTAAALAALLGGLPLAVGVAATAATRAPSVPAAVSVAGLPADPAAGAQPAVPTGPTVPASASAPALAPGADAPAAPTPDALAGDATAPAGARASPSSQLDALRALATPSASLDAGRAVKAAADAAPAAPAATTPTAQAPSHAPLAMHSSAAPAAQPTGSAAPIAPAAPSAVAAQSAAPADAPDARGVALEHAIETVRLTLRAAADRGVTQARISLNPRELGSIEVHLRQTADGLVARVVAQHAAAAQLLQQNGADLRRTLESQGLNLLRLDIGASGEQGGRQAAANGGASGDGASPGADGDAADEPLTAPDGAAQTTATATLALPNGALVDVLA